MRTKRKTLLIITISILLIIISVLIYLWDFVFKIDHPLLTNILSSALAVIITLFGVNKVLDYRDKIKWKRARGSVLTEINHSLNAMLTYIRALGQIDESELNLPIGKKLDPEELDKAADKKVIAYFKKISDPPAQDFFETLKQQNSKAWSAAYIGLQTCTVNIQELMTTFPYIISNPDLVNKLMEIRSAWFDLYSHGMLYSDIIGIPLDEQPKSGKLKKEAYSNFVHEGAVKKLFHLITTIIIAKETISLLRDDV